MGDQDSVESAFEAKEKEYAKVKATHGKSVMSALESAGQKAEFLANSSTILSGMIRSRGRQANLKPRIEDEPPAPEDGKQHRPKHMINILTYGHPEIDYSDFYGDEVDKPGLTIWRIDGWRPVLLDSDDYMKGPITFYDENAYMILWNSSDDESRQANIHYWLGEDCKPDKAGAAAVWAIALNIHLGGWAHLNREEQGDESGQFIQYFQRGYRYDFGSSPRGFKEMQPCQFTARLYEIRHTGRTSSKTKKTMLLCNLSYESLRADCVYVLDNGLTVFQWNGGKCNFLDRIKGIEICNRINNVERSSRAKIVSLEQEDVFNTEFWEVLGGYYPVEKLKADDPEEKIPPIRMFQMRMNNGKPEMGPVNSPVLAKSLLESSSGVYILDCYTEIFVWYGRKTGGQQKRLGKALGTKFLTSLPHPSWTPILTVHQSAEPITFREKFSDWYDSPLSYGKRRAPLPAVEHDLSGINIDDLLHGVITEASTAAASTADAGSSSSSTTSTSSSSSSSTTTTSTTTTSSATSSSSSAAAEAMPDDGSGTVEMWNLEGKGPKFTKVPPHERGHFYGGDCYLVLYTYRDEEGAQKYIAYFWQGAHADDKWWAAFLYGFFPVLAKKMGGGKVGRLRAEHVYERKEPDHFAAIFGNTLVVHRGSRRGNAAALAATKQQQLFHVRRALDRVYAVEVPRTPASLSSRDSFLLKLVDEIFLWHGASCTAQSRRDVEQVAEIKWIKMTRIVTPLAEGDEIGDFWSALGGEALHPLDAHFWRPFGDDPVARLFSFSFNGSSLLLNELRRWGQRDLTHSSVMMLDVHRACYFWVGSLASDTLILRGRKVAERYAARAARERSLEFELTPVADGSEPLAFTAHFHAWSTDLRAVADPEQQLRERIHERDRAAYREVEEQRNREARLQREKSIQELKQAAEDEAERIRQVAADAERKSMEEERVRQQEREQAEEQERQAAEAVEAKRRQEADDAARRQQEQEAADARQRAADLRDQIARDTEADLARLVEDERRKAEERLRAKREELARQEEELRRIESEQEARRKERERERSGSRRQLLNGVGSSSSLTAAGSSSSLLLTAADSERLRQQNERREQLRKAERDNDEQLRQENADRERRASERRTIANDASDVADAVAVGNGNGSAATNGGGDDNSSSRAGAAAAAAAPATATPSTDSAASKPAATAADGDEDEYSAARRAREERRRAREESLAKQRAEEDRLQAELKAREEERLRRRQERLAAVSAQEEADLAADVARQRAKRDGLLAGTSATASPGLGSPMVESRGSEDDELRRLQEERRRRQEARERERQEQEAREEEERKRRAEERARRLGRLAS